MTKVEPVLSPSWHFYVAQTNGGLHISSRSTDRRSADYVIQQLHHLMPSMKPTSIAATRRAPAPDITR